MTHEQPIINLENSEGRRNISIGIPLDLSIPTEMTSIEPLVENKKIIEYSKEIENYVVLSFLTDRT